jgi:murein DD-endopeptidase MepM/ murein hydrolase activator NlpD
VSIEDASPAGPAGVPASPLSRRELRERMRAGDTEILVETVAADVETVAAESEPAVTEIVGDETDAGARHDAPSDEDAFIAASRAFASVATDPAMRVVSAAPALTFPAASSATSTAPRRGRRVLTVAATVGVMGIAGLLAVSMTLPAQALAAAQGGHSAAAMSLVAASASSSSGDAEEIQAYVASSDVQNDGVQRANGFSTASLIDIAGEQGISYSNKNYTNDPDAAIQWPFMVGVGMSYGYGMRNGTLHEGLDLLPGDGAPVQSIADGTVRIATESGGNYGVTVYIDHMIDGQLITSHYAHMQYGSLRVVAGQKVKVGDIIGKVGNTGRSYGAHMHFELIVDGSTIDPQPWLYENAGRYDGVSPVS